MQALSETPEAGQDVQDRDRQAAQDRAGVRRHAAEVAVAARRVLSHYQRWEWGRNDIRIEIDGEEVDDHGDSDFDTVLDVDEVSGKWGIVTEVGCTDTYNMAGVDPSYLSYGDNEVRARIAEGENLDDAYKADRDWANPGCQSLKHGGPNLTR